MNAENSIIEEGTIEDIEETIEETTAESALVAAEEITSETIVETAEKSSEENNAIAEDSNLITDSQEIEGVLEAIIFAAPKAISLLRIKNLLRAFSYDISQLNEILNNMVDKQDARGFQLIKVGGGYQYRTHPKHSDVMQKMLEDRPAKLSPSALEVLSIVSYKQPITRTEIDSVRGVDSGHLMKGLLEKNLVRTVGHAESPGRPMLYGTAPYFLEVFGLNSLDDLPALDEMNRELVNNDETSGENDSMMLANDPGLMIDGSSLAANPDRGAFDEPNEEAFEQPDFGETERALEN
jgi:segregation and condensation protein B